MAKSDGKLTMGKRIRPDFSVVVCTWNRPDSLQKPLMSLMVQDTGDHGFEIVVVDNAGCATTRALVERMATPDAPPMVYVMEPRQGLSVARNRGIAEARGRIVAFIDDDALADRKWVAKMREVFDSQEETDAAGGPIIPLGGLTLPSWFPPRLRSHLSIRDYGDRPRFLTYPHYVFGTNMAFRRRVFTRVGKFDPLLGRIGEASFNTGEETDLFLRIERAGGKIFYAPAARAHHRIHPERICPKWLHRQTFWIGLTSAVMEKKTFHPLYVHGQALLALPIVLGAMALMASAVILRRQRVRVFAVSVLKNRLGYLCGLTARTRLENLTSRLMLHRYDAGNGDVSCHPARPSR